MKYIELHPEVKRTTPRAEYIARFVSQASGLDRHVRLYKRFWFLYIFSFWWQVEDCSYDRDPMSGSVRLVYSSIRGTFDDMTDQLIEHYEQRVESYDY